MKNERPFYNSEFGYVFTYNGRDTRGYYHSPYSVLAHNPEELYEAMKEWHSYGNPRYDVLIPNDNFRRYISAIFGVEDGTWEERECTMIRGNERKTYRERFIKNPYNNFIEVRNIGLKTTNCGAWGIDVVPALAPTLEEHQAIETAQR